MELQTQPEQEILRSQRLYKNHGKAVGWWQVDAVAETRFLHDSPAKLVITFAKTEDGEVVTKEVPIAGKNVGRANQTTPRDQAQAELQSRVNKQLDKGYVYTKEAAVMPATNSLGKKMPMLALGIDKVGEDSIDWATAYAQPKLDGHRCMNDGFIYSRQGKEQRLPHIMNALEEAGIHNLPLDGELYRHGLSLQQIGSLIKKPREESLVLQYHVYDLVLPVPYSERLERLREAIPFQAGYGSGITDVGDQRPIIQLVPSAKIACRADLDLLHKHHLSMELEGSILRHGNSHYLDNKRNPGLVKIKDFDDTEFEVEGYEEGTPIIIGGVTYRVPVWICTVPGKGTVKATAAGTAQEKDAQWQIRDEKIGKKLTLKHFGYTPYGIPDLPVALKWWDGL